MRKMKRKQVILGPSPLLSLDIDTYSRHRFLITSFNRITFSKPEGIGEGKRERESRQAFASSLNRMREVSRVCDTLRAFTRNRERNARSRASQFPPREWRDVESKEREKEKDTSFEDIHERGLPCETPSLVNASSLLDGFPTWTIARLRRLFLVRHSLASKRAESFFVFFLALPWRAMGI